MLTKKIKPDFFRPRWSKVLSDLWSSKFRTLLVVASIAVGVFAIGVIAAAYAILAEDIDHSYAAINAANISALTDPFDEELIETIGRLPGVKRVEGRLTISVRTSQDGLNWHTQTLVAVEDFEQVEIGLLNPLAGVPAAVQGEIIVHKDFMNDFGYQVGDLLYVRFPDGDIARLPIVGLVADQTSGADPAIGPPAFVTLDTLEHLGQEDRFNRLYITIQGDGNDESRIAALSALVEEKIKDNHRSIYRLETRVSGAHPMKNMALAVFGVLGALGVLITILSSSLIINTLNALLVQHMRQIGVMKLVGGSSSQIMGMYLGLILSYSLLALLISVPAGALAGYALAQMMADMMNIVLQGFRLIPLAVGLQALLAFLIPLGAGFFPVNHGARINVRRAISSAGTSGQPTRLGGLDRLTRWLPWLSRPILLSIRNTFRQRGRLALTIFTLTTAGAVFIAVFNVRASMGHFMEGLMQHFLGDVTVNFSQPYPIPRVEKALLSVPGVEAIEAWGGAAAEIWDADDDFVANLNISAPPSTTDLLEPDMVAGRWLLPGEAHALVISDAIYDTYPDLQPGDALYIKLPGKRPQPWQVVGVFRFLDMIGDPLAYADQDYLSQQQGLTDRARSFRLVASGHTLQEQRELAHFIEPYLEGRGFEVGGVEAGAVMREDSSKGIDVLVIFLLVMALLTAFVGSIGLTGTMGMNVLERTREIGVMRAIGAVDLEVIKSVVIEGVMIGLITWVLAIGFSFPISSLLLRIISQAMMGSAMSLYFTPLGIYIWLGVVVALSFLASILPARNAARLTINEVLAYE